MKKIYSLAIFLGMVVAVNAQSTYNSVYNLLQTNCQNATCHSGATPSGDLALDVSLGDVYTNIIDVDPINPAALAKGNKIVDPGYPERSFLMRKCATSSWDDSYSLDMAEGDIMPDGGAPALANTELELIRQWILEGAPQTGNVVNQSTIADYYSGMGLPELPAPPAPAAGEGFQVRVGPLFLDPLTEIEYLHKYAVDIAQDVDVTRVDAFIDDFSHHFILYKFDDMADADAEDDGRRVIAGFGDLPADVTLIAAWQNDNNYVLPYGTGYFWDEDETALDMNYHVLNYNTDSVFKANVYFNVYTQPRDPNTVEMHGTLITYADGFPSPFSDFLIPDDATDITFTESVVQPSSGDLYIWTLASHTHKYGLDYDIYLRQSSGAKGDQVYEGYYNYDYTFNQGFYDWAHPPIKYFEPQLKVDMAKGFIHEAKFNNYGSSDVTFGLTTDDEMMLFYVQYTEEMPPTPPVSINEIDYNFDVDVYPNPVNSNSAIVVELTEVSKVIISLTDLSGKVVANIGEQSFNEGTHFVSLSDFASNISAGTYLVNVETNGVVRTKKLVKLQ